MADANKDMGLPSKVVGPKFMLQIDGMGMGSTVKGFEKFVEIYEWGMDAHCYSAPQMTASFSQQEPPSTTPMYLRVPLGLHLPKLMKAMIEKKACKEAKLLILASIGTSNQKIMEITMTSVAVEEVRLGNNVRGHSNKNYREIDNNFENSFEILLRFGSIEWAYTSFDHEGKKEGQDVAHLNMMTGEVK